MRGFPVLPRSCSAWFWYTNSANASSSSRGAKRTGAAVGAARNERAVAGGAALLQVLTGAWVRRAGNDRPKRNPSKTPASKSTTCELSDRMELITATRSTSPNAQSRTKKKKKRDLSSEERVQRLQKLVTAQQKNRKLLRRYETAITDKCNRCAAAPIETTKHLLRDCPLSEPLLDVMAGTIATEMQKADPPRLPALKGNGWSGTL
jgi:hypothetical protein